MTTSPNEPAGPPPATPPEPPRNEFVRALLMFVKVIAWAAVALAVTIGLLFGTCALLMR